MHIAAKRDALLNRVAANLDEEIDFLSRFVRIPSLYSDPTAKEECQDLIAGRLRDLGCAVDRWRPDYAGMGDFYAPSERLFPDYLSWRECSNVLGRRAGRGEGRSLLCNGHMDVVPIGDARRWTMPPWGGQVAGGHLYGRGACDQKAGLTAALFALQAIIECDLPLRGDLFLAAVVDEESSGNGTRACLTRGYRADAAIFTEPTGLRLANGHVGGQVYRITVEGKAAHPSSPDQVNAVDEMMALVGRLRRWEEARNAFLVADPRTRASSYADLQRPAPLDICSFQTPNEWLIPAEWAQIAGQARSLPWEEIDNVVAEMIAAARQGAEGNPWLRQHPPRVDLGPGYNGYLLDRAHPLVELFRGAYGSVAGAALEVSPLTATCDAWVYGRQAGVPTVIFGPGEIAQAHAPDEHVSLDSLAMATRVLAFVMAEWCA